MKVLKEKETRKSLIRHVRLHGYEVVGFHATKEQREKSANLYEKTLKEIFDKYDKLLRNCKNDKERKDISELGALEVHRLLGGGGELYVNNKLVVKDDE